MNLSRMITAMMLLGLCVALPGCATPAHRTSPDYLAMSQSSAGTESIEQNREGQEIVIVGRLKMPRDAHVASRTPISDDGSYRATVYPGRRLVFYAHGCDPLEISPCIKAATNVCNAGTRSFIKAGRKDMRRLQGRVIANQLKQKDLPIKCSLQIKNDNSLFRDDGYQCGAPITVPVGSKKLSSGQSFTFNKLSRIPYSLVVTAPGYIEKELGISQDQDGVVDLGNIALDPAETLHISYICRVRHNGGEWIGDNSVKTEDVLCNGRTDFYFSDEHDGLGNSLELRMRPDGNSVEASFFFYKHDSFYRLGSLGKDEIPDWDKVDTSGLEGSTEAILQDGQLYYFTVEDINGTDIQLLFRVEI